jgi:hypothetical protein
LGAEQLKGLDQIHAFIKALLVDLGGSEAPNRLDRQI